MAVHLKSWRRLVKLTGKRWASTGDRIASVQCVSSGSVHQDVKTVDVTPMENTSWSGIRGNASAPYINNGLMPMASHAEQYFTPPGLHPSLPNYLWLETGTNFNVTSDVDPSSGHQGATNHLVTLLKNAGISWTSNRGHQRNHLPADGVNEYAPKHNPMRFSPCYQHEQHRVDLLHQQCASIRPVDRRPPE